MADAFHIKALQFIGAVEPSYLGSRSRTPALAQSFPLAMARAHTFGVIGPHTAEAGNLHDTSDAQADAKETQESGPSNVHPFRRGGVIPTSLCLTQAALGAGLLSVSSNAAEVGAIYQLSCLLLGGLLSVASLRMIAVASVATQCWSFEEISEELFHPAMSFLTGFMNSSNCLGAAAACLITCGQVFQAIFQADERTREIFVVSIGVCICAPLALAEHIGFLRHLAAFSLVSLLFLVAVTAWYLMANGMNQQIDVQTFSFGSGEATVFTYINCISSMVYAFCNQFSVPQLTGEMTPTPSTQRMTWVALLSTWLSFLIYGSVSILGLLAFGINQKDTLILDLMPVRQRVHVVFALVGLMFGSVVSFQFHIFAVRQFCAFAVRKARAARATPDLLPRTGGAGDGGAGHVCGRTPERWYDIVAAMGTVACVMVIAVKVSRLQVILNLIGAFAAGYISFVVPPLWILAVRRRERNFSWLRPEIFFSLAMLAFGIFLVVVGTYSAILPDEGA